MSRATRRGAGAALVARRRSTALAGVLRRAGAGTAAAAEPRASALLGAAARRAGLGADAGDRGRLAGGRRATTPPTTSSTSTRCCRSRSPSSPSSCAGRPRRPILDQRGLDDAQAVGALPAGRAAGDRRRDPAARDRRDGAVGDRRRAFLALRAAEHRARLLRRRGTVAGRRPGRRPAPIYSPPHDGSCTVACVCVRAGPDARPACATSRSRARCAAARAARRESRSPRRSPYYHGAVLFRDHCSGCHTLSVVGAQGSATSIVQPRANQRRRTSTSARRTSNRCSTRSATAASPARSCPRTSSSATTRRRSRSSSRSTPGCKAPKRCPSSTIALRQVGRPGGGRGVLDLRLIREDPDGVRAALARRGAGAAARARGDRSQLDARRRAAAARARGAAGRAERRARTRSAPRKRVGPRTRARHRAQMQALSAQVKELERASSQQVEARAGRALARAAEPARPRCRRRGPEDELVREVGEPPELGFAPRDHLELAGAMIDMDARRAPVGRALRLPERRPRDARAGARALGAGEALGAAASSR